jgi:metal-dependent amidase/aminoacylase/carboxypeptidase family protein
LSATPITGGEDFSYMSEGKPGAIIFIGDGINADGGYHAVHTSKYVFNDEIIPIGAVSWVGIVEQDLNMGRRQ